jgi:transposase
MIINTLWGEEEVKGKVCNICHMKKPLSEFHKCSDEKIINGKRYEVKYRSECKKCRSVNGKANSSAAEKLMKDRGIKRPPIGTPCDNCGKSTKKLIYDHCHETEEFRGWLCYQCNTAIGNLGDNLEGLMQAVRYLQK